MSDVKNLSITRDLYHIWDDWHKENEQQAERIAMLEQTIEDQNRELAESMQTIEAQKRTIHDLRLRLGTR